MNTNDRSTRQTQWQALIEEQEKSDLSQKEFCRQRHLVLSQFGYYRGRMKVKGSSDNSNSSSFIPIQVNQPTSSSSFEVRVVLPNGFQCYFPYQLESLFIKRFMEILLSC